MTSPLSDMRVGTTPNVRDHFAERIEAWLCDLRRAVIRSTLFLLALLGAFSFLLDSGDCVDLWLGLGCVGIAVWHFGALVLIWRAQTPWIRQFTASCVSTLIAFLLLWVSLVMLLCAVVGGGS